MKIAYDFSREDFAQWCKSSTDSSVLSIDLQRIYYGKFRNDSSELLYEMWFAGWNNGYKTGEKLDSRMGINDEIEPSLMTKRLRDWA